jgi:hypothetical protein
MRWFKTAAPIDFGLTEEDSWGAPAESRSLDQQFEEANWDDEPEAVDATRQAIAASLGEDAARKWDELSQVSEQRQSTRRDDQAMDWDLPEAPTDPIVNEIKNLESLVAQGDWKAVGTKLESDYNSFVQGQQKQEPRVTQQEPVDPNIGMAPFASRRGRPKTAGIRHKVQGKVNEAVASSLGDLEIYIKSLGAKIYSQAGRILDRVGEALIKDQVDTPAVTQQEPSGMPARLQSRNRKTKTAMKCQDCGDDVDQVDAHGDCESCQKKAELNEPTTASAFDLSNRSTCRTCGETKKMPKGGRGICSDCANEEEGDASDELKSQASDGHWTKTAGEMIQCGTCDALVDEDEMDRTGMCSTCQADQETMEQTEVQNLT